MPEHSRFNLRAGVFDSTAASLASFLAGLLAIWSLSQSELGVYAVFFSAFLAASYLPRQLIFIPVEMLSVDLARPIRAGVARRSLVLGALPCSLAAGLTFLSVPAVASMGQQDVVLPLAVTTYAATLLSPLQDHTRRILHLAGRSWRAGIISLVHLGVVGAMAIVLAGPWRLVELPPAWIPMGVLAAANMVSLGLGLVLVGRATHEAQQFDLSALRLRAPGLWLAGSAAATKGAGFVASAIIGNIAGASVLGIAEAARVAAQPVMVLGIGLQDAMSPRLMENGADANLEGARAGMRAYFGPFLILGIAYLGISAVPWLGNPMHWILPEAYEVGGLVAVSVLANLLTAAVYPFRLLLLGARRHRTISLIEMASSLAPIALAFTASASQAFARPLGLAGQGLAQLGGYAVRPLPDRKATDKGQHIVAGGPK